MLSLCSSQVCSIVKYTPQLQLTTANSQVPSSSRFNGDFNRVLRSRMVASGTLEQIEWLAVQSVVWHSVALCMYRLGLFPQPCTEVAGIQALTLFGKIQAAGSDLKASSESLRGMNSDLCIPTCLSYTGSKYLQVRREVFSKCSIEGPMVRILPEEEGHQKRNYDVYGAHDGDTATKTRAISVGNMTSPHQQGLGRRPGRWRKPAEPGTEAMSLLGLREDFQDDYAGSEGLF